MKARRSAAAKRNGLSMNANYTRSRCVGNTATGTFPQLSTGYVKPNDPSFDYGHCTQDRTHIGIITLGYVTPQFNDRAAAHDRVELALCRGSSTACRSRG